MIRIVLDTNVVISAILKSTGPEARIIDLVAAGTLQPCISAAILSEYLRVAARPFLRAHENRARQVLSLLAQVSENVSPGRRVHASPDEDDNRFLECAEEGHADFLVTGDRRHFPPAWAGTRVVSSRELLAWLATL